MSSGTRSTPNTSFEETKWLSDLYDTQNYSEEWIDKMYDEYRYQGFNREEVLADLEDLVADPKIAAQIIIVCALRGPVRASLTKVAGKTLVEWGIPVRRRPGTKGVSCGRITSATADLAAYFLKKFNAPKRIDNECPGWLQFPSAGSIKMPESYRKLHIDFSQKFSVKIGGEFKFEIYEQMVVNAYLDPTLNLFG
jgi:hypothetical protein